MTVTATSYVPLLLRSNYSLLTGTCSIDDILRNAVNSGMKSVVLTDTNNLYAAIPFYNKALKLDIKPVIGVELVPGLNSTSKKQGRLILLARNYEGYSNVCRIITRVMLENADEDTQLSGIDKNINNHEWHSLNYFKNKIERHIAKYHEGVYFLSENPVIAKLLSIYVDKRFIKLLIIRPDQSLTTQREIYRKSKELGVDAVGTTNTYFLNRQDYSFFKLLQAIKKNSVVDESSPSRVDSIKSGSPGVTQSDNNSLLNNVTPENFFYSSQEMYQLFSDCPALLEKSQQIISDCNVEIPMNRYVFPKYPIPDNEKPLSYLYKLCLKGAGWRYGVVTKKIIERLKYELNVIDQLGFPEYFLVVGDIIRYARSRDIPVVGRGSGASSIVAYSLGITNVDPVKYNLCFERFMHILRKDYPDLDIDLCWRKRDEVINYVYETYGSSHVAMISTHNKFQPRSAFRESAKAFGMPNNEVNMYSKYIPHNTGEPLSELSKKIDPLRHLTLNNKSVINILKMADRLTGMPRHTGIHSGGIVITDKPIDSYVPLERSAKGVVVTQFDMRAIEGIGLVKLDLLGNRALSTLRETINLVEKTRNIKINRDDIPDKDPGAVKLLKTGTTLGCFQIESPGMRNLLKMLKVSSINETIASLSLIRPGPASGGLKESYVRRARGLEPVIHIDSRLEPVLKDSYGIMLYEEDAIRSASAVAGISLAEGDEFRRSIAGAETKTELNSIFHKFIALAGKNGVPSDSAALIGKYIGNFAKYTFCKAHAAGYGVLAYQGAYLKAHYPVEFIVALMNNHQGMYARHVHIEEARRFGIAISGPCVNKSQVDYGVEKGDIRIGLSQVKGLTLKVMEQIVEKRPFSSLPDFINRVKISKNEAESLLLCGAMDFTTLSRPQQMWELETTFKTQKKGSQYSLNLPADFSITTMPLLQDYTDDKKYRDEYDVLEIFVNCHPMKMFRAGLAKPGLIGSSDMPDNIGKTVMMAGIMAARRSAQTKRDEKMMFITLEDEKGLFEVTLFPPIYRKYCYMLKGCGPYVVKGKVEDQYGALTITLEMLQLCSGETGQPQL